VKKGLSAIGIACALTLTAAAPSMAVQLDYPEDGAVYSQTETANFSWTYSNDEYDAYITFCDAYASCRHTDEAGYLVSAMSVNLKSFSAGEWTWKVCASTVFSIPYCHGSETRTFKVIAPPILAKSTARATVVHALKKRFGRVYRNGSKGLNYCNRMSRIEFRCFQLWRYKKREYHAVISVTSTSSATRYRGSVESGIPGCVKGPYGPDCSLKNTKRFRLRGVF
jgi:hypothetical protein